LCRGNNLKSSIHPAQAASHKTDQSRRGRTNQSIIYLDSLASPPDPNKKKSAHPRAPGHGDDAAAGADTDLGQGPQGREPAIQDGGLRRGFALWRPPVAAADPGRPRRLSELLSGAPDGPVPAKFVAYQVRKISSGKPQGVLNLSYRLGEVTQTTGANGYAPAQAAYTQAAAYPPTSAYQPPSGKADTYPPPSGKADAYPPPAAYPPAAKADGYPPPGGAYPPAAGKPAKAGEPVTAYPAAGPSTAAPYAAPPSQYGGYGYPPPQAAAYGYPPPPQAGYGYQQQPKKKNNFGMGLGAGLLGGAVGGLLVGDMISDSSAYDAGYDAGFDDGGGFDF
jgi:hypothetical protein